jgi:hypothetical protein
LSVVNYFKSFGENEVVFVTDDKSAFRGKESFLCDEFKKENIYSCTRYTEMSITMAHLLEVDIEKILIFQGITRDIIGSAMG